MRVDVFRRLEHAGSFTYLAVPEGCIIPNEAANVDWEAEARGVWLDDDAPVLEIFSIKRPNDQIDVKGYAISSSIS